MSFFRSLAFIFSRFFFVLLPSDFGSALSVVWTGHNGSVEFVLIVPTHNVASTLERTIASIRAQCYSKFSVWISDDASVDGSFGLAQTLASKDPRFHFRRSERRLGALRNYIETIDAAQSSGESVIVQVKTSCQTCQTCQTCQK